MQVSRFLRYLAPNLITLSSMIFGLVSLWSSHNGDTPLAAWLIIYAVLTDRLDGLTARALKATSELGMQLVTTWDEQLEQKFGADGQWSCCLDEGAAARNILGVVGEERVEPFVFDLELDRTARGAAPVGARFIRHAAL